MNGIIPLNKELGMTSADCVYKLRKILHERRIGHTGTLDPQVDGVLPICVGQATKLVNMLTDSGKEYIGEITLGYSTTTEDREGDVVEKIPVTEMISEATIDDILNGFVGSLQQVPPMYSAVKVNGKKLYEYARAGETVERPIRTIEINSFKRTSQLRLDEENQTISFNFDVECSKGTYVRTLAVQVGEALNLPSHMSQLTRIKSAGITLSETVSLNEIETFKNNNQNDYLISIEEVLSKFTEYELSDEQYDIVKHGGFIKTNTSDQKIVVKYNKKIKAIYQLNEFGKYQPDIMLLSNE
ncbi:tRNA pseudouridine synthase B [Companilactobacillus sp. RD055328]|uniref:tRNA pseudouridine(55) synthase TruB n=1 Tax=Companilactobacillus sp. RD055328 TaxID=2916634 RepID=UPI001FC80775|nr:tRNA pseudouridine(55) synthase TruB [Companilactobacillus sp. RD055328]GKQ42618.1 tRNA pseudouridine synthase B [Companilactobacillus sp. RD055328]